ncbi:hypothetical protein LCGC14_2494050 [marine sediment metagenome]|uniref:Phosphate acetyl/butaryl transferase domain-containing protein n=1 Tax=marine sediment metagenome TaxID=412755 RepID=A0A0F9DXL2_9ZZZZ
MEARAGDYQQAATYYKRALDATERNLEALFSLSEVMQRLERWEESLEYIDEILRIDQDNHSAFMKKRALLERDSRWEDLIEVQRAVLRLERDPERQQGEASTLMGFQYELACAALENKELDKASKGFRAIVKENNDFIPAHVGVAETMIAAARHVRRFGITPKIALCSSSQFGNLDSHSGRVARGALALLDAEAQDFEYEGEMHTDAALDPELRDRLYPDGRLTGRANVLVYTNADAAGAARNLLKSVADGLEVGPILMGMGNRAHIVTPGVTVRGLLNTAALAGTPVASYG